jgi:hypothetical protein
LYKRIFFSFFANDPINPDMKKIVLLFTLSGLMIFFSHCSVTTLTSLVQEKPLTETEVIQGLKRALDVGSTNTTSRLSNPGGYLNDPAIKILLPEEANKVISDLKAAPGGSQIYAKTIEPVVNDLVSAINHSAEEAAKEALPVFKDAITGMSVTDAFRILKGQYKDAGTHSATQYFRDQTFDQLKTLYQPKVNNALNKPVAGNKSTNQIWDTFVKTYNQVATSPANLIMKLEKVKEPDLSAYVTSRALNGLYSKIELEEDKIRQDPYQYADQILERVFGSIK